MISLSLTIFVKDRPLTPGQYLAFLQMCGVGGTLLVTHWVATLVTEVVQADTGVAGQTYRRSHLVGAVDDGLLHEQSLTRFDGPGGPHDPPHHRQSVHPPWETLAHLLPVVDTPMGPTTKPHVTTSRTLDSRNSVAHKASWLFVFLLNHPHQVYLDNSGVVMLRVNLDLSCCVVEDTQ